jgi:hypothetical protein
LHGSLNSETCRNQLGFSFHTLQQLYWPRDASAATTATTTFVLSSVFLVWQPIWLDWKNRQLKTVHDTSCWTSFFLYLGIFGLAVYAPCVISQHQEDTNSGRFLDPVKFIAAGAQRLVRLFGMPLNYSKWGNSGLGLEIIRIRYDGFYTIWRHIFACSFMFMRLGFWRGFCGILVGCPKILLHTYLDGYTTRKYHQLRNASGKRSSGDLLFPSPQSHCVSQSKRSTLLVGRSFGAAKGGQGSTIWSIQMTRNPIHRPCPARAARNHVSSYISKC